MSKDLGDFQTPPALVEDILHYLRKTGKHWTRAFEPTCGQGNFIQGLLKLTPVMKNSQPLLFLV